MRLRLRPRQGRKTRRRQHQTLSLTRSLILTLTLTLTLRTLTLTLRTLTPTPIPAFKGRIFSIQTRLPTTNSAVLSFSWRAAGSRSPQPGTQQGRLVHFGGSSWLRQHLTPMQATYEMTCNAGAIHLFDPNTAELLGSAFGAEADQGFGARLFALSNGNLVSLNSGNFRGVSEAGSVSLLDGDDLSEIATLGGDAAGDGLGQGSRDLDGLIELLGPNAGRFLIHTARDEVDGNVNAGSVILVDGTTGAEIVRIEGDDVGDELGSDGVFALRSGNFVILTSDDDAGGLNNAGSITLVDGATGDVLVQRGGDDPSDFLGGAFAELTNGSFVVGNSFDDDEDVSDGSVFLIDGANGNLVAEIRGSDVGATGFGQNVLALDVGSVIFFDSTGVEASRVTGGDANDNFGGNFRDQFVLANGNIAILSEGDDVDGATDAGSVVLIDGTTFAEIARIEFDDDGDLDDGRITALPNGNLVITAGDDTVNGVFRAGSMTLVDGSDGSVIAQIAGAAQSELRVLSVAPIDDDYFILATPVESIDGVSSAGAARVIDSATGEVVARLVGDNENDFVPAAFALLDNGGFVLGAQFDDVNGRVDSGSVLLVNSQ